MNKTSKSNVETCFALDGIAQTTFSLSLFTDEMSKTFFSSFFIFDSITMDKVNESDLDVPIPSLFSLWFSSFWSFFVFSFTRLLRSIRVRIQSLSLAWNSSLLLEILLASSRLHRESLPQHFRINPMLERFRSSWFTPESDEEEQQPETVVVNLNVEPEETKYVQLRIERK